MGESEGHRVQLPLPTGRCLKGKSTFQINSRYKATYLLLEPETLCGQLSLSFINGHMQSIFLCDVLSMYHFTEVGAVKAYTVVAM